MVGMFVCLCLASQNPFEREFFVPARTDLGVNRITAKDFSAYGLVNNHENHKYNEISVPHLHRNK